MNTSSYPSNWTANTTAQDVPGSTYTVLVTRDPPDPTKVAAVVEPPSPKNSGGCALVAT